jgi:ER lumen protein retaining receptor
MFYLVMHMTNCFGFQIFSLRLLTSLCFAGISLKTQELYALVFASRYLDMFTSYVSFYNTVMKLIFLGSSFSIVWYMRHHKLVRRSYDKDHDTFRHFFIVLPCLILALLIHEKFTFIEVIFLFRLIILECFGSHIVCPRC